MSTYTWWQHEDNQPTVTPKILSLKKQSVERRSFWDKLLHAQRYEGNHWYITPSEVT